MYNVLCAPVNIIYLHENQLIVRLKKHIINLQSTGVFINIIWIKAHVGFEFNEKVYRFARSSIVDGEVLHNSLSVDGCINIEKQNWKEIGINSGSDIV